MRFLSTIALGGALLACGGPGGDDDSNIMAVEVEPAFATITVPLGTTATQDYKVFGVTATGKQDITSTCILGIDPDFGSFTEATAVVVPRGGKAAILASCGMHAGMAVLAVNLVGEYVVPPAPSNAPGLFGSATTGTDPARMPVIEYPLDRAVAPRNMPPVEAQWKAGGNDLFHVRLTSGFVNVDVYTTSVEALLGEQAWQSIMDSAAGDTLGFTVEGLLQSAPAMKFASTTTTITVSRDTIDKTAIYYWASSQGNIMEQTFGATTPPNLVKDDCTSCHSVNRAGTRIGYSRCVGGVCGAELHAGFLKYDAGTKTWVEAVNANNKTIRGSYSTFSPVGNPYPTDEQSVAIVSMATGTLQLYDPDTGTPITSNINTVSQQGPGAPRSALMADWSPDGTKVVFTSSPAAGQWIDLSGGSIAMMSYTYAGGQHVFGDPQFIIPNPITLQSGSYTNFFFPSFSPDGALLVFNAARTSWRGSPARAPGQRLMLADANGAWTVDMPAMNSGYADLDITWAHWAPTVGTDYYWVVFSSQQDYGHRVTPGNSDPSCLQNGVTSCKQIWIGAVAKNKLTGLVDPSAPPMWMPGQDIRADNISPYWSVPAGLQ